MDAPTISIKIRGLQAVDALNNLGGLKINGANALLRMGEVEANRAALAGKGAMMREMEMEGNRMLLQAKGAGAGATKTTVAATNAVAGAKTAAVGTTKAAGAGAVGTTMFGSKGIGALWLGGLGPWLVLTSLGLAATGIYFYLRAQRMMHENAGFDRDEVDET